MNTNNPSKSGYPIDINLEDALHAVGFTPAEIDAGTPQGIVIFKYTRAQAIADGVLVDLTADGETKLLVQEAGILLPIAMTSTAFHATVLAGTTENASGEFIFPAGQSTKGRLWDVLMVLRYSIRAANRKGDTDRVTFKVDVDTNGDGKHTTVNLWCMVGPGDDASPVLTVMLEGED
jgi:hypothetical protein